jgi:hypothetical protein
MSLGVMIKLKLFGPVTRTLKWVASGGVQPPKVVTRWRLCRCPLPGVKVSLPRFGGGACAWVTPMLSNPTRGAHSLTAVFTPANPAAF